MTLNILAAKLLCSTERHLHYSQWTSGQPTGTKRRTFDERFSWKSNPSPSPTN